MLAISTLVSCSKEMDNITPENPDGRGAILTLNISTPTVTPTRTGTADAGTTAEQTISSLAFACYDASGNQTHYDYFPSVTGTTVTSTTEIPGTSKTIFVIANPTASVEGILDGISSFADVNKAMNVAAADFASMTTDNQFMMTNTLGLIDLVKPVDGVSTNFTAAVTVSRVVAKIELGAIPEDLTQGTNADDIALLRHVMLTGTNKSMIPYSEYVDYTTTAGALISNVYRKDANYEAGVDSHKLLNWFGKDEDINQNKNIATAAKTMYCLENTVDKANQFDISITKLLFRAEYIPNDITANMSEADEKHWFRYKKNNYTLATLVKFYNETATPLQQTDLNAFAVAMGVTDLTALTFAELNQLHTEETASKVIPYTVDFYRHGVCYYAVNLKHDTAVEPAAKPTDGVLGRWGTVRNNWYTYTVKSIKGPGLPYMPDPTDPDITDPVNPDPENPDPVDPEKGAKLEVTVTVKQWAKWADSGDLS